MKNLLLGMLLVVMVGMLLVSCDPSGSDQTQLEQIIEKGKIVVGTSADYPPYEFHMEIDGKDTIVGFDITLAEKLLMIWVLNLKLLI